MATPYSIGHGMRRRSGTPSNPLEAAGKSMSRTHATSEEHYDAAASAGSFRIPISAAPALEGTLVPKKSGKGDTVLGAKVNRENIERVGATYRVQPASTYVQVDPAAGPTMANAKIVPSVQGRANPNFEMGIQASTL